MTSEADIREVGDGQVRRKRRITQDDWARVAEFVSDEYGRRKNREDRRDKERQWKEIDRQVEMTPDISFKLDQFERVVSEKAWMPELEIPRQAQALEVLTADAMAQILPLSGPWFKANSQLTEELIDAVAAGAVRITNPAIEAPSLNDEVNVNRIVEGVLNNNHRQYDFRGHINRIQGDVMKYGVGIGRARMLKKPTVMHEARGVFSDSMEFPALIPHSIKDTYLDDNEWVKMNEGYLVGPSPIFATRRKLTDITLMANRGSKDPNNPNGGWMPKNLNNLEPLGEDDSVDFLDYEGDLVLPRKSTRSIFVPGVMITVVRGKAQGKADSRVVRLRYRKMPFSSYVIFPYHQEDVKQIYTPSPLMKGRPVQIAAVEALNRTMQATALNAEPPISYDRTDPYLAVHGGPVIHPGALNGTTGIIQPMDIGDPSALFQVYIGLLGEFDNVTGVNQPRLGAQTRSHTTAFAKDAELARGSARTVDYVGSALSGPMTQWIGMEYAMTLRSWRKQSIYIDGYRSFVEVERAGLPNRVTFEVFGSNGPAEARARLEQRFGAVQQVLQVEQFQLQVTAQGLESNIDFNALKQQILREGGWTDVETLLQPERGATAIPQGAGAEPGVAPNPGSPGGGATIAALQDFAASGA